MPESRETPKKGKKGKKAQRDQGRDTPTKGPSDDTKSAPSPTVYYNLAVKQKAVYQPVFKCRRWLEERKRMAPPGVTEPISDIESRLPPLCGDDANFTNYVREVGNVKERLDRFYNTDLSVKKYQWDAREALDAEFTIITNRLFHMVGGATGRQRDKTNKVVIGVGLGQFSAKTRLSSLHTSFQSYFVKKVSV